MFENVGHANQAYRNRNDAKDGGLRIKESCHEDGKKTAQDGPNDEYVECGQGADLSGVMRSLISLKQTDIYKRLILPSIISLNSTSNLLENSHIVCYSILVKLW